MENNNRKTVIWCACRITPPGSMNTPELHGVGDPRCSRELVPSSDYPDESCPVGMYTPTYDPTNARLHFKHPCGTCSRLKK